MNPVLVSTWGTPQKYFHHFIATAKRNGMEPQNFDASDWPGKEWNEREWFRKSCGQARFVREHPEASHFVFTDSYDIVFEAGLDEIMAKYQKLDSPIVWGAECYPWPKTEQASLYPPTPHRCKYLNAGCWIGEREAALRMLEDIEATAKLRLQCDQGIAVDLFLSKKHPVKLDTACSILFCCNIDSLNYLDFSGKRIKTTDTGEQPCLYHGNGASDLSKIVAHLDANL